MNTLAGMVPPLSLLQPLIRLGDSNVAYFILWSSTDWTHAAPSTNGVQTTWGFQSESDHHTTGLGTNGIASSYAGPL